MTILPVFQTTLRTASRTVAISLIASARMWPTPSSTFSTVSTPFLGVDEFLGRGVRGRSRVSSRFQIRRASGSSPLSRASDALVRFFGLERQVEVFEPLGVVGRADAAARSRGQLPLGLDRLEDRLLPLRQLAEPLHAELDLADDHLVEVAGPFLAVARDERDGVALVQQLDDALHLHAPDLQILRDPPRST